MACCRRNAKNSMGKLNTKWNCFYYETESLYTCIYNKNKDKEIGAGILETEKRFCVPGDKKEKYIRSIDKYECCEHGLHVGVYSYTYRYVAVPPWQSQH